MSALLTALIEERRQRALKYETYLAAHRRANQEGRRAAVRYLSQIDQDISLQRAYDNLDRDEPTALVVEAVLTNRQDDWRNNNFKRRRIFTAIRAGPRRRRGSRRLRDRAGAA